LRSIGIIGAALPYVWPAVLFAQPAQTLRVLSSNGVRAPLVDARAAIETAIGSSLDIEFSTAASLADRIEAGEPFDVAVLTEALIERLVAGNHIVAESAITIARAGVGIGAQSTAPYRDVGSRDALRRVFLAAESVALTADGQSRPVVEAAFETLGIAWQMQPKIRLLGPGEAPDAVARGEAELVLTLVSEILPVTGVRLLGRLPDDLQDYVRFTVGISPSLREDGAARAFAGQLTAPPFLLALREHGLETLDESER